jgi:hypothetical protein
MYNHTGYYIEQEILNKCITILDTMKRENKRKAEENIMMSDEQEVLQKCATLLDKMSTNEVKMLAIIKELSERVKQLEREKG